MPTASDIVKMLALRHADDVFVPGCKDGPTQGASVRIMDAWTMKRSWARPCMTGYEIKVSRSDFERDSKWVDYVPLCHRFYFVSPPGVVSPVDLPDGIGLLWTAKSGGQRLVQKKAAAHREIDPPVSLLIYILMCRTKVYSDPRMAETREERAAIWERDLAMDKHYQIVGHAVGRRIHQEVTTLKAECAGALLKAERLTPVQAWLDRHGLASSGYVPHIHRLAQLDHLVDGKRMEEESRRLREAARSYAQIARSMQEMSEALHAATEEGG